MNQNGALLVTATSTLEALACQPLFNADAVPFIHAYSSIPLLQPPAHAYATQPTYADACAVFMEWLHDSGQTPCNLALYGLGPNNAIGSDAAAAADALAASLGINVVAESTHLPGVNYVTAKGVLQTQILPQSPDWLYVSSIPAAAATIVTAARDLGMTQIGLGPAATSTFIQNVAPEYSEGIYGTQTMVLWGTDVPGMDKAIRYCQRLHPQDAGNSDYLVGWHLGMCTVKALQKALGAINYKDLTPRI